MSIKGASWPDRGILLALTAWAVVPLAYLLLEARGGEYFTGADGPFAADQLQYMAWIREAGEGLLISNDFDLAPSADAFLHPMFVLSGLAWKLGVSIQLAYLLWKPVAVAVLFLGFWVYVARLVAPGGRARPAALVLALFHVIPLAVLTGWGGLGGDSAQVQAGGMALEVFTAETLWGYPPAAIAVGLMPIYLIGIERLLDPASRRKGRSAASYAIWAALAGGLASWIHPWQGLILIGVTAGLVVLRRRLHDDRFVAIPLIATLAPLAYYFALSRVDTSWGVAETQSAPFSPLLPLWVLAGGLAPIGIFALIGMRGAARSVQESALRLWPLVALAGYFLAPGYRLHMLTGIALPLAIFAVRGWGRLRLPAPLGAAAVLALTAPGMAYIADGVREAIDSGQQPNLLRSSEGEALRYLEEEASSGGVLSTVYLGVATPALSGHPVWVGHPTWTPDPARRISAAEELFSGRDPSIAGRLVRESGARFVLAGCRDDRAALDAALAPLAPAVRRFGCATVYELDASG